MQKKVAKTIKGKPVLLSEYAVWFSKEQEPSGLLSSLGTRTSLDKIPIVGPILFKSYQMNEIINSFLISRK